MGIPIRERESPSAKAKAKATHFKNNYIQVRCSDQHGEELTIRIKARCPFQMLQQVYCQKILPENCNSHLTFLFRGKKLKPEQTPEDVEMVMGEENFIRIVDSDKGAN